MNKNYNFDMKHLLDTFDGDAEKLANAFADSLNAELSAQRKANDVSLASDAVAEAWEEFVITYNEAEGLPDDIDVDDLLVDGDTVQTLLHLMLTLAPYIEVFNEYMGKISDLNEKAEAKIEAVKKSDTYDEVMKRFFNKNNI